MQNDLISRSALLEKFNSTGANIIFDLPVEEVLGEDIDLDDFATLVQDAVMAYRTMVIDMIEEQPTAYDVKKIVEQLEENSKIYCEEYHQREGSLYIQDVVEIVRNGGKE